MAARRQRRGVGRQTTADLETIRTVRQYLIEHPEVSDRATYSKHSPTGKPGAEAIAAFLGGIWTEIKVKNVLDVVVPLEKGEVDEDAIRAIPTTSEARKFVAAVRRQPVHVQRQVAEAIRAVRDDLITYPGDLAAAPRRGSSVLVGVGTARVARPGVGCSRTRRRRRTGARATECAASRQRGRRRGFGGRRRTAELGRDRCRGNHRGEIG
jgi:hypothetical protein